MEMVAFKRQHLFNLKTHFFFFFFLINTTSSWFFLFFIKYCDGSLFWWNSCFSCYCKDLYSRGRGPVGAGWWWKSTLQDKVYSHTCGCRAIPDDAEGGAVQDLRALLSVWFPLQSVLHPRPSSPHCSFCPAWQFKMWKFALLCKHSHEGGAQPAESVCAQPAGETAHLGSGWGHHLHSASAVVTAGLWSPVLMCHGLDPSTATVGHVTVSQGAQCFI